MSVRDLLLQWSPAKGTQPTVLPAISRVALATLALEMGWTSGAEIGVWKGAFSAQLCQANPHLHLLCVDPWQSYAEWEDAKNKRGEDGQRVMEQAYRKAIETLASCRCTIWRKFSVDAAADVDDQSLDFAYIDGNHGYVAVLADLEAWVPKVKRGGVIAGHDYGDFPDKPGIRVAEAVQAFTSDRGIDPWFVLGADKSPSFLWEVA